MRRPGSLGLINAPVPIAIHLEKAKRRREIERIHHKLRLQPVLPPAPGISTEHLVIGGLLAILLLRKDSLPIDNLLLPLVGVGAFLWYKNKTKEIHKLPFEANQRPIGPFMPTVSNGYIGPFMPTVSNGDASLLPHGLPIREAFREPYE